MASPESRAGRSLKALRRRAGLILVVLLIVLFRVSLPLVLKPVIESQASKALRGRVEIGALHLWLLLGGVQLEKVAVFPEQATEPILGWKRLYLRLGWGALFRRTIQLREIELDTPFVEAERLKSGELNLQQLLAEPDPAAPAAEATPAAEPAKSGEGWTVAIDKVTLATGQVGFLDRQTAETHPLSVVISKVDVDRFALRRETYGEPARIEVEGQVEGAPVRLQASLSFIDAGLDLDATVETTGMPIHRAQLYLPHTGWSALKGLLDASLHYRLETGARDELTGRAELRDLVVAVPELDRPALQWRSLAVALERIDLLHKSAAVKSVGLDGVAIVVRPEDPVALPVLPVAAPDPSAAPPPEPAPAVQPEKPAAETPAWQWSVATVTLANGRLVALGAGGAEDIGLRAVVTSLVGKPQAVFPFEVSLAPSNGTLEAKGTACLDPLGFQVGLRWQQLSLPSLVAVAAHDLAAILKKGTSSGDLTIAAGMPGGAVTGGDSKLGKSPAQSDGALRVRGRLGVAGLEVVGEDPKAFSARLASLDVEVTDIRVPKILPAVALPRAPEPIRVKLGAIRIAQPVLRVTRSPEGIVLPAALAAKPLPAEPPKQRTQAAKRPATPAAPPPQIAVASVTLDKGDVVVVDKTMKPPPQLRFSAITMKARGISQPGPRVDDLAIRLTTPGGGPLSVTGHVSPDDTAIKVSAERMGLPTYNPYVSTLSGYSIADGHVSVESSIALKGSQYQTDNRVTLQDLALAGAEGENLFAAQFGVPLSLALALMRDYQGNITLDVPVAGDASGTTVDLKTTLASVLRQAILNAVTSPLKVLGMVQLIGDKVQGFGPEPVPFVAGAPEPAEGADPRIDALGSLLASRPGLRVELQGVIGAVDAPRMREMDFLEGLRDVDAGKKPPRVEIDLWPWKRKKYHETMEAREGGGSPELDEDDKKELEKLIAAVEIAPARLQALAVERARRVQAILFERRGIPEGQIVIAETALESSEAVPSVKIALATASATPAPAAEEPTPAPTAAPP